MNAQRWIALGILALTVLCFASMDVWLYPMLEDEGDDETPTPTPEDGVNEEDERGAEFVANLTPEPTLNPVVAEILEELEVESLGVGDDPFITMSGDFTVIDSLHRAEGTASIYQIGDDQFVLRLDPFTITGGPDLHVLLSMHEMPRTSAETLLPSYLDLGSLKSTTSAQNYEIVSEVDLKVYKSAVIYSLSLNVVYSTATLKQVRGQN